MGQKHRVVIIGGGFGGLYAAISLRKTPVEVTLLDRRNFHLFQPLLYQVATGSLSPGHHDAPPRARPAPQGHAPAPPWPGSATPPSCSPRSRTSTWPVRPSSSAKATASATTPCWWRPAPGTT